MSANDELTEYQSSIFWTNGLIELVMTIRHRTVPMQMFILFLYSYVVKQISRRLHEAAVRW